MIKEYYYHDVILPIITLVMHVISMVFLLTPYAVP
jgi:hypothetical protein